MSGPITDLEVLKTEYAVEGWTWKVHGEDAWLWREDSSGTQWSAGMLDGMLVVNIWPGGICSCWPEVAIAVCCAHLGVPTPWRLAERLEGLAKEERDVERELGESPDKGRSSTYEHAAAMARGES